MFVPRIHAQAVRFGRAQHRYLLQFQGRDTSSHDLQLNSVECRMRASPRDVRWALVSCCTLLTSQHAPHSQHTCTPHTPPPPRPAPLCQTPNHTHADLHDYTQLCQMAELAQRNHQRHNRHGLHQALDLPVVVLQPPTRHIRGSRARCDRTRHQTFVTLVLVLVLVLVLPRCTRTWASSLFLQGVWGSFDMRTWAFALSLQGVWGCFDLRTWACALFMQGVWGSFDMRTWASALSL